MLKRWENAAGQDRNPAFGLWADRDDEVAEEVRRLRAPREFQ